MVSLLVSGMLLVYVALAVLAPIAVPAIWGFCRRVGLSPYVALLLLVPLVGPMLTLSVLALARWSPAEGRV